MKSKFSWYRLKYFLLLPLSKFINIFLLFFDIICFVNSYSLFALILGIVLICFIVLYNILGYIFVKDEELQTQTKYRTNKDPKHKDYMSSIKYLNKD